MASQEGLRAGEPDRQLERIQELERVFGHFHAKAMKGDICTYCGLDLRDLIHHREPSPKGPVSERLQAALDRRHWDIQTLKDRVSALSEGVEGKVRGVAYSSVYAYLKGSIPDPPLSFLRVAAKALGVRVAWLAFGDGEPFEVPE